MRLVGEQTTTDDFELMQAGKQLHGDKFAGVYLSDQRSALSKRKPYAILNTKPTSSGGEHWVGLARMPSTGKIIHYNLFGRSHQQLFPSRWEDEAIDTELDVEQGERTTECGQRSLAWLLLFDQLGSSAAKNDLRAQEEFRFFLDQPISTRSMIRRVAFASPSSIRAFEFCENLRELRISD